MPLTVQDIKDAAIRYARKVYVEDDTVAYSNLDDAVAVLTAIENSMEATTNNAATQYPGISIRAALLAEAQAADPNLTVAHASVALAYWALKAGGII